MALVPAWPPSPFAALLQTTPIGMGIGYRGGEGRRSPSAKTFFIAAILL